MCPVDLEEDVIYMYMKRALSAWLHMSHGIYQHNRMHHSMAWSDLHSSEWCTGLQSWRATHANCRRCSPRQPRLCSSPGETLAPAPIHMPVLACLPRNTAFYGRCSPAWRCLAAITCCGSSIGASAYADPGSKCSSVDRLPPIAQTSP